MIKASFVEPLISPAELCQEIPLDKALSHFVEGMRRTLNNILKGFDSRLVVMVGPCSLHHPDSTLEYARLLKELSLKVSKRIVLVMRAFLEKPRSRLGWKGLMHDPGLDGTSRLSDGLRLSRKLLKSIAELAMPTVTEFLEPFSAHYIADLISAGIIGARTSASPLHRQLASALDFPVGFKNSLDGDVTIAVHGALAARSPHAFMTIDTHGRASQARSSGNPCPFVILRGSDKTSNYDPQTINKTFKHLQEEGLDTALAIDCSHGNSGKDFSKQPAIFSSLVTQFAQGLPIKALMLESHLEEGSQTLSHSPSKNRSITDSCLGWPETQELILQAYQRLERSSTLSFPFTNLNSPLLTQVTG